MGILGMGQGESQMRPGCRIEMEIHALQAIYITAELSAPARQLPLAINTAIPTIILCFIAANAAYYILLPWNMISTTDSVAVVSFPSCSIVDHPTDIKSKRLL